MGCPDLDPNWPDMFGKPRGERWCVLYPNCKCGKDCPDLHPDPGSHADNGHVHGPACEHLTHSANLKEES